MIELLSITIFYSALLLIYWKHFLLLNKPKVIAQLKWIFPSVKHTDCHFQSDGRWPIGRPCKVSRKYIVVELHSSYSHSSKSEYMGIGDRVYVAGWDRGDGRGNERSDTSGQRFAMCSLSMCVHFFFRFHSLCDLKTFKQKQQQNTEKRRAGLPHTHTPARPGTTKINVYDRSMFSCCFQRRRRRPIMCSSCRWRVKEGTQRGVKASPKRRRFRFAFLAFIIIIVAASWLA